MVLSEWSGKDKKAYQNTLLFSRFPGLGRMRKQKSRQAVKVGLGGLAAWREAFQGQLLYRPLYLYTLTIESATCSMVQRKVASLRSAPSTSDIQ